MAEATVEVSESGNDETKGTAASSSANYIMAQREEDQGWTSTGHVYLDVIGAGENQVPSDATITAVVLYFNTLSYDRAGSKPLPPYQYYLYIYNGVGTYELIESYSDQSTAPSGLGSYSLISAEWAYVGDGSSGGSGCDTEFRFNVSASLDSGESQNWKIDSYDLDPEDAAYLVVTYTPAAGGTARVVIVSC